MDLQIRDRFWNRVSGGVRVSTGAGTSGEVHHPALLHNTHLTLTPTLTPNLILTI